MQTQTIQTTEMSWPRFIGLLQTDGSFIFFWEADKTLKPKVILTAGLKNQYMLSNVVKPWLQTQGILSQIQKKTGESGITYNLSVERQDQVLKVIDKIDQCSAKQLAQLLDEKLTDYLVLKHVLKRTKEKKTGKTKDERVAIFKPLVDLKTILLEKNKAKNHQDSEKKRAETEKKLEISDTKGCGAALYIDLVAQSKQLSSQFVKKFGETGENCTSYSIELGQYVAGIIDGDGSFQVNFIIHEDKRPNYEFKPAFTLTDGGLATEKHSIFELFNRFFGNSTKVQPVQDGKNFRLTINSEKVLSQMVQFIPKVQLVLVKNITRFTTMKQVVGNKSKLGTDQEFALLVSESIEMNFADSEQYRNYKRQDRDAIINKYFEDSRKTF
jgi:hypothetical protein